MQIPNLLSLLPATAPIRGIGTDLVEIEEFRQLPFTSHRPFYEKVFTPGEIAYCQSFANPAEHFAARFAAKEAVIKAFGGEVYLDQIEIEVSNAPGGQPFVRLCAPEAQTVQVLLSLSHSQTHALAFAVAINQA